MSGGLYTLSVDRIVEETKYLVNLSRTVPSNGKPAKEGGILTLALEGFSEQHILEVGKCAPEKKEVYRKFSQEKAHRVCADWLINPMLIFSSWQTRDVGREMYGGAVIFTGRNIRSPDIVSFSGLTEESDEAVSLILGYNLRLERDPEFMRLVTGVSKNKVFREMAELLPKHYMIR